ncbi:low-specificity L-threonine aldolase [Kiloniella sp. b19]|uniref:low-specificity L-threonine aldolase n=1 Tax=Kiloniella sp. GXU_MW_B19 TaxID=3141326 RepID=UPI0031CE7740
MSLYGQMSAQGAAEVHCDLRSDTMTRPDAAMREAMAAAPVGDDVYGEDPVVNLLEQQLATRLGKEAAVFFPTGTQSNLAALMAHCGRGDEVIVGQNYHIYCDEAAGASVLAGISMVPAAVQDNGAIRAEDVRAGIREDDPHYAISRLLCLENTVGGQVIPLDQIAASAEAARAGGLAVHLDGARFFNAVTALGCPERELAGIADTLSICLSKGLGTPAGSVLLGPAVLMKKARRNRKILGGAMRQSGILAAAGLHALEHNVASLAQDHSRAEQLAQRLRELDCGEVRQATNMIFFTPEPGTHAPLRQALAERGVLIGGQQPAIRMVFHRDVTDAGLQIATEAFEDFYR